MAELIRRRAESGCDLQGPAQMPSVWDEFTEQELAAALARFMLWLGISATTRRRSRQVRH